MHKNSPQGHDGAFDYLGRGSEPYWLSMMKLAAADWSMASNDVACLLERNLVAKTGRVLTAQADDRVVLGLTV